ncbi:MAG: adenylate/guanylate cyclase domain-containing protein, partial [Candidatus Omnitrophica bacterium]|nr:adenylate/guanylate cyclase domain-containing protein [Candidatus Omnitrophota bacterium]
AKQLERRNAFITRTFGRYLSDDVVERILDDPRGLSLGGELRTVTVLMNDLRGFTSMCERLRPAEVVALLNRYLECMTAVILEHEGTIDEFIGDAILVIFGAPLARPDDARRAVACALSMMLAMDEFSAWCLERGLPQLEMGIGLNTGDVIVGNIGSERRLKYGIVGATVNLTSRIETYTVG